MGFCKICTGFRLPGMHVKIVVNLKKDIVCRECEKHYEIKAAKRRGMKKLVIFISRLSYCVRPSRRGGAHRLLLPISRHGASGKRESGWVDIEISWGDDMGDNWLIPRAHINLDVGIALYGSRFIRIL